MLMASIKSTRQVRQFWDCFTKQLALPKRIVSMLSTWLRRFPISFEQLKIGSPGSRAEVGMYQEKADRAEQWLHKVYTEIEDRFLRQDDGRRGSPQRRQGAQSSR